MITALLVSFAAGSALTSCGGSKDDASARGKAEAKRTYQARATRTCSRIPELDPAATRTTVLEQAPLVRAAAARRLDTLRALGAPEQDRATLERYFQSLERLARTQSRVTTAATDGTARELSEALRAAGSAHDRSVDLARSYGLDRCAR